MRMRSAEEGAAAVESRDEGRRFSWRRDFTLVPGVRIPPPKYIACPLSGHVARSGSRCNVTCITCNLRVSALSLIVNRIERIDKVRYSALIDSTLIDTVHGMYQWLL